MASKQPQRKKKTRNEIKKTRQKAVQRQALNERGQVAGLRKDRIELQHSLAEIISEVSATHRIINSAEVRARMTDDDLTTCEEKISEFKTEIDAQRPLVEDSIRQMEEMETNVLSKKTRSEDIVLPYNLIANPLMDSVFQLTHKGIDTLTTCAEVIAKYENDSEDTPDE